MAVTSVQHVSQAASEGLNDLCDPHDPLSIRTSERTTSEITAKSRASRVAIRQLQNQEKRVSVSSSSSSADDDDAFLMSFIPLKTEPSLFKLRRSFRLLKLGAMGSPSTSAGVNLACNSPRKTGVTKKLLRLCMGSRAGKYTPLPVN